MSRILVTGGTGYIGSHTVLELLEQGFEVTAIDNLSNSSQESLRRVEKITGKSVTFHQIDVRDQAELDRVLEESPIDAVIHFAGSKAVGESVNEPLSYYENNVGGLITLCQAMDTYGVRKLIFSSSATVYGRQPIPYTEQTARAPENPYGRTKYVAELIMEDLALARPEVAMIALRYFNPIGAHASGQIGEDPLGIPNNLMPFITQVATGQRPALKIFGNDYPTKDGTGVRDYIHVVDLAKGHVAALRHAEPTGFQAYNLGGGQGSSVLEVIQAFETATGQTIAYEFAPRRDGDIAEFYADASLAHSKLQWRSELSLETACADAWRWQEHNPTGYR
ncbi:MAG: galE [Candidatus Saccharibacteria bacterium]|nr:galE [Candidatus Saccharibacteria bacterium]